MQPYSAEATFALELVKEAGKLILELRNAALEINLKGPRDLVTSADLAADALISRRIRERFPMHAILSEESAPTLGENQLLGDLWVIDPIDGTTNYALGHYQCAVSIAFYRGGEGLVGAVYAPFVDELFFAERNRGAYLNQTRLHRAPETLQNALVATGFPYLREPLEVARLAQRAEQVLLHCRDLRRLGAASLDTCWVACGRLGAYYESVNAWDIAAARIVAIEAGAVCGNIYPEASSAQHEASSGAAEGSGPPELRGPLSVKGELYSEHFLVTASGLFNDLQNILQAADALAARARL